MALVCLSCGKLLKGVDGVVVAGIVPPILVGLMPVNDILTNLSSERLEFLLRIPL